MAVLMMLSREVRRVPLDFEHPKRTSYSAIKMAYVESHQPVYDAFYVPAVRTWLAEWESWQKGEHPDQSREAAQGCTFEGEAAQGCTFEDWHGNAPNPSYYHPGEGWPAGAEMGICMYETVTEGTPISRVYPDTADGRIAMASELAEGEHGITTGLSVEDWLGVITDQVHAKDIHTGELS